MKSILGVALACVGACSSSEENDARPSQECVPCSGAEYVCNPPGYESYDIKFESGGDTECTGVSNAQQLSTKVRLKCDFSELCTESGCRPAKPTATGFLHGTPGSATTCTLYE